MVVWTKQEIIIVLPWAPGTFNEHLSTIFFRFKG